MPTDLSISHWVDAVATRQWAGDREALAALGNSLPDSIIASPELAQVHRLDLALFTIFEEASLRVSGALTRLAPNDEALRFAAQQTLDEARHHEMFSDRLTLACRDADASPEEATEAILIPPLRQFVERCYEVADGGSFIDAMVLMNLVLEGMAHPLYAYEERYWMALDPYLARLVRAAFKDEARHVHQGSTLVRSLLKDDPARRARAARLCAEARTIMGDIFTYYIREFVSVFDTVAKLHPTLFADTELAPGKPVAHTLYEEQVELIHMSINDEHTRLIDKAGLSL